MSGGIVMRFSVASILIFIALGTSQNCTATDVHDSHDLEARIWAMEETYVTAYKNADHDSILALMHERFLGWPDSEETPTEYHRVPGFLEEKYGAPGSWSFKIDRAGIRVRGDVVITHYVLIVSASDDVDSSQAQETRITHTWIREGAGWQILGGMSNDR
jgi:ketosteroid isomerase-like protein